MGQTPEAGTGSGAAKDSLSRTTVVVVFVLVFMWDRIHPGHISMLNEQKVGCFSFPFQAACP